MCRVCVKWAMFSMFMKSLVVRVSPRPIVEYMNTNLCAS